MASASRKRLSSRDQNRHTSPKQIRIMSSTRQTILQALRDIRLIDPHSHINPHQPASKSLADILGYHYYTELVHSAGMPKRDIEAADISPRELVGRLVKGLPHLTNTAQHAWLIDICRRFFGFEGDAIDASNWESVFDAAEAKMQMADWADSVLDQSNVEAVFLTNDFDDELKGFDTRTYIPCLRTDDLVFHLSNIEVRDRLAVCSGIGVDGSLRSLHHSLEQRFEHFVSRGARACAISLPPDFSPAPVSDGRAATALDAIIRAGSSADASHKAAMAKRVFWTIVELCDHYRLPMDLMIGVNRGVYEDGVHQGRDLYDSRVSLTQYRELFNTFPDVKFPISVLASVTNQELVSHAWIFPNVITNGHWWYSNAPSFIRRDAAARLEAVPRNKQIGYYSDAYKLEFIAPKFDMYRSILAGILADDFVIERGWSEEQAIALGRQVLRGNVDTIFPDLASGSQTDSHTDSHTGIQPFHAVASERVIPIAAATAEPVNRSGNLEGSLPASALPPHSDPYATMEADFGSESPAAATAPSGSNEEWSDSTVIEWAPSESAPTMNAGDSPSSAPAADDVASGAEDDISLTTAAPMDSSELEVLPFVFDDDDEANASDPHSTIGSEHDFVADPLDALPESDIRYFRADDEAPGAKPTDSGEARPQLEKVELYTDPITGELIWPADSIVESDASQEDPYLLSEEPDSQSSESEPRQAIELRELDDLELAPLENDDDLEWMPSADDELSDIKLSETEGVDFDGGEQKS